MKKYDWLVRQKNKSLALFHKMIKKMESLQKDIMWCKDECEVEINMQDQEINKARFKIMEQQNAIQFLDEQHKQVEETKSKIQSFLT